MTEQAQTGERIYKGIPVSAGICQGKAFVLHKAQTQVPHYEVADCDLPQQVHRFQQALVLTRQQILEVQHKVSQALNAQDASIFDAHLLVLEDPTLIDSVTDLVQSKKINVEAAFQEFAEKYTATLSAIDDAYLRERVADMRDVTSRIMNNLLGNLQHQALQDLREPCIIIARRSVAVRSGGDESEGRAGFWHRRRQQDLAHGHHGPFVASAGRGRA